MEARFDRAIMYGAVCGVSPGKNKSSLTTSSTPTRRPANGTNSTSWVSVWNCGAFGHRDELAADEA